jgi:ATP-binding cassette, subfamily G (WHITE), member 2, SNQ2
VRRIWLILWYREYAFYRPSAVSIARVLLDFPVIFVQVVVFGTIMYFMTNLDVNASKFFIFELLVFVNTICITALYRMFAALSPTIDDAVRFSGIGKQLLVPKMMALQMTSGGRLDNGDTCCQR